MIAYIKPYIVAIFGYSAIEFLQTIPGYLSQWVQLFIGLLTIIYLIKKILKK